MVPTQGLSRVSRSGLPNVREQLCLAKPGPPAAGCAPLRVRGALSQAHLYPPHPGDAPEKLSGAEPWPQRLPLQFVNEMPGLQGAEESSEMAFLKTQSSEQIKVFPAL